MDSYHDRIVCEINEQLDSLAESGARWVPDWITTAICEGHRESLPESGGWEFWYWNASSYVREMVRKQINKRAGDTAERPDKLQLSLDGFERKHLQRYYLVERDEGKEGIPVADLTDDEIDAKAGHYRAMGKACYEHADELLRYKRWRNGDVSAEGAA